MELAEHAFDVQRVGIAFVAGSTISCTRVSSIPTPPSATVAATLAFAGNSRAASRALPSKKTALQTALRSISCSA
jgi:hypothetical protein